MLIRGTESTCAAIHWRKANSAYTGTIRVKLDNTIDYYSCFSTVGGGKGGGILLGVMINSVYTAHFITRRGILITYLKNLHIILHEELRSHSL